MSNQMPFEIDQIASIAQVLPSTISFCDLPSLIAQSASKRPEAIAIVDGYRRINYTTLDRMADRIAASLQRDGVKPRQVVAICASTSAEYVAVFLGVLRAGAVVAPLSPSATPNQLIAMLQDANAQKFFVDQFVFETLNDSVKRLPNRIHMIQIDGHQELSLKQWLASDSNQFLQVKIEPDWTFNLIYSSGTTGIPKGIVQSHQMRWLQLQYSPLSGFCPSTITLIATPMYSNTTMTTLLPTLAFGGRLVLMSKFDTASFLKLAQSEKVTHTMLVPVQYQRLLAFKNFDKFNLNSFLVKFCTSAPLSAACKAEIVSRWPGTLIEYYGMTEGGGTCMLIANLYPKKLHTVGQPVPGHDIRLIDEYGLEVNPGEVGEVVGRSSTMMDGYRNQASKTSESYWVDSEGNRFIKTGDIGRFDKDGFLILLDRRKDMIISGGFNIYPSDLENVILNHPAVFDTAVVGVPSEEWGETPMAFVVRRKNFVITEAELLNWANRQLGKTQRIKAVKFIDELPRSAIGKILKRELRDSWTATFS